MGLLVVTTVARLVFCCSTRWRASKRQPLDGSTQLERNWRNAFVVVFLVGQAIACAAPAFTASVRPHAQRWQTLHRVAHAFVLRLLRLPVQTAWSVVVPVKLVSRAITMAALRHTPAALLTTAVGGAVCVITLAAVRCQRRRRGPRGNLGSSLMVSDRSIAIPAIQAGSRNQPVVVGATGEVSMAGTAAPNGQLTGAVAVAVYAIALFAFQPLVSMLLRVWACGPVFRPYVHNGDASEECLVSQECWQVPHLAACGAASLALIALLSIATVTLTHTQRVDSRAGTAWSTLPLFARLQVQLQPWFVLALVLAKVVMAWAEVVYPTHTIAVRHVDVPFPTIVATAANVVLLLFVFALAPSTMACLNIIPRYAVVLRWLVRGVQR